MNKNRYDNDQLDTMNPAPRCPVVLLLDTSSSMSGEPIEELNDGLKQFINETCADEAASMSVELEIILFDSNAKRYVPFKPITDISSKMKPLMADGMTSMGAALSMAKKDLEARRKLYRNNGVSSYRPWVILMTDGEPNDDWEEPARDMRNLAEKGKIQFIGIEIGSNVNHNIMCSILPDQPGPVKLQGLKFKRFFRWLTDSLRSVSQSAVSDQDNVMYGDIRSWADLDML